MLSSPFSPWRSVLTPEEALDIASGHLENAQRANTLKIALVYCDDAKSALSRIRKSVRKTYVSSSRVEDQSLCTEIAATYFKLGNLLDSLGYRTMVQASRKNGEKWGGRAQFPSQSSSNSNNVASPPAANPTLERAVNPTSKHAGSPTADPAVVSDAIPSALLAIPTSPVPPIQDSSSCDIVIISPHIFAKDMDQPPDMNKLPKVGGRLENISQLVHCLTILQPKQLDEDALDQSERDWLKAAEHDKCEHERLKMLVASLLREFAREGLKDAKVVAEVVCLVPVLTKDDLQQLLQQFFHGTEQSILLDFSLLEGLSQLVQRALPGHLNLVNILEPISVRLKDTYQQLPDYIYQLTLTVSHVLDAMADSGIKGLDREKVHAPLVEYLRRLQRDTDPYLVYQAAYASQALMYVPDDETPWQSMQRLTGKVVGGGVGLVSGVKGLDLNRFVENLSHIQGGLAGASKVFTLAKNEYEDVSTLATSEQQLLDCLREDIYFGRKRVWYPALRNADSLLRSGQLIEFKILAREASCRSHPAFQWGMCQRLGELAANEECNDDSRASAVAFIGEMYQSDKIWGHHTSIKQLILDILMQLSTLSGRETQAAKAMLQELETDGDVKKQALYRTCLEGGPGVHALKVAMPSLLSTSLLDRVQNNLDIETRLGQLKVRRLKERGTPVYISPQAKANLKASDDTLSPLMDKVKEFLGSERKVFLVLGDSGAGKSTFNQELECDLWNECKKNEDRIPLFITLAAIQNPEQNLVAKQLQDEGFTERQIQELKDHREFILICDGYDESRQTQNLYKSNRLNVQGGWRAQMVVSCRSEYLGSDYRDRFQPVHRNRQADSLLFQEAVIAPFTKDQIKDYIEKFVSTNGPLWQTNDYLQAFNRIPGLRDLVRNPFLLTLSLTVLPHMVDPRQNLSATRITRIALYDQFVEQWLERGKIRLLENFSSQDRRAFERLSDEGFMQKGIEYLKGLATAIFQYQSGSSVVEYPSLRYQGTWKEEFFGQGDEMRLLREACPLKRSGNQYRFLHRSLLEYSLARAVFEPQKRGTERPKMVESTAMAPRRRNVNSDFSLDSQCVIEDVVEAIERPVLESPLGSSNFVDEPSILRFLTERVQQEPLFKKQLLAVIERSKTETTELETIHRTAANAITILIRSGEQFIGVDLQGIRIPGADLSHGAFEYAQLQGADMTNVILRSASLRGANLNGAQMAGVQFVELPFLLEESGVRCCVYSLAGKTFAVGLEGGNISIYTISDWNNTKTLSGHSSGVMSIAYSPNGDQIVSGSRDKTVRLWDVETGDCRHTLSSHSGYVTSVVYSPKDGQIASGSADSTVRLWDVETGDCRHTLSGHSDWVRSVVYSPKGDQIASGSDDMTVRLWDIETGECRHTLSGHREQVLSVAYSPKGDQIASGSCDMTVRLWDVETGDCRHSLSGHSGIVNSVVYSPKGVQIASTSSDHTVRLWDVETGDCHYSLSGDSGSVSSVVYSPKGDQIASGSADKTMRLWDTASGECRAVIQSGAAVNGISWIETSDKMYVVAGCLDGLARLWRVVDDGNEFCVRLHWISRPERLNLLNISMQDVGGLSRQNKQFLLQRGAVGEQAPL